MDISRYISKYISSKLIFALDLFLLVLSSVTVLFVTSFFSNSDYYQGTFAIWWLSGAVVFSIASMLVFKSYKVIVRHSSLRDFVNYGLTIILKDVLLFVLIAIACSMNKTIFLAICCDVMFSLFLVLGVRIAMILAYDIYRDKIKDVKKGQRVLIYGTSDKSVSAISRFRNSSHYRIVGFISPDPADSNLKISEYSVYVCNDEKSFSALAEKLTLDAVLFVRDSDVKAEENNLIAFCTANDVKTLVIPSVDEVIDGKVMKGEIRKVRIEDLLGRDEIKISMDNIRSNFEGKVVMVTGAAGSIGSELCRQLALFGIKKLILFDNAETPMHNLRLELEARFPALDFVPLIGSIRHKDRLDYAFRTWKPQVVFHAAAYKHVPLMEENPCEAVFANVYGSRMVADKCVEYGVEMMVMISTDKAVNPTNIMGCSKRLAEIYVQSLGLALSKGEVKGNTKFVTTRFGNVLGSNGSVIPRFREQIENGGPVTVTHPDITRFFMTIPEACRLVMEAATMSSGNQIFVFDMGDSVKIVDLARRMIELAGLKVGLDIDIEFTGLRPGEKLYEEVLANQENTEPTSHDRIRIAKVREYDYAEVAKALDELAVLSKAVEIDEMVKLMKALVPEFKSKNSRFEIFDKQ